MKTLAEEFERPALFMLQRYGRQAERIAVSWAMALEADGLTEPANHWRSVAGSLRDHGDQLDLTIPSPEQPKIGDPVAA
jgi:hypothetical protein